MSLEEDRAEILRIHNTWLDANRAMETSKTQEDFADGDGRYLMYNLNGHPYFSLAETKGIWEAATGAMNMDLSPDIDLRLEIRGDMAWLACENVCALSAKDGSEIDPGMLGSAIPAARFRLRSTEIYMREDGEGNAVWKLWHIHCSDAAPEDEVRIPQGDTYTSRAST